MSLVITMVNSKKVFLEISQNLQENTCVRASFYRASFTPVSEALAQVFSCEFCKISDNTFLTEHLWTTVSNYSYIIMLHYATTYYVA